MSLPEHAPGTWLLLRGLTREAAHWGDFIPALAQALPAARIATLDLPGNGQLHAQASPWSVPAMVRACREQAACQGLVPPFHVLALSLGAMVGVAWAHAAPREVAALVAINTSMRPFSPLPQRLRPANYPALLRLLLAPGKPLAAEATVLRLTSNHPPQPDALLADWAAVRARRPVKGRNALRQLVAAARFRAPQAPPPCPVLLLASTRDHLVDMRCSQAMARAWQCPLHLHPTAGHDLPLDDPHWVARHVKEWPFLRSNQPLTHAESM